MAALRALMERGGSEAARKGCCVAAGSAKRVSSVSILRAGGRCDWPGAGRRYRAKCQVPLGPASLKRSTNGAAGVRGDAHPKHCPEGFTVPEIHSLESCVRCLFVGCLFTESIESTERPLRVLCLSVLHPPRAACHSLAQPPPSRRLSSTR
ncbi:hypothetical protein K458DRAFT_396243 [Lentithecium fluviatile CBS 122367]|uniref:Uncharacterized protein n=1 Tax=Lentithecium fluviatile CBS 122367 TaxID=1168545 RepID=A0A6G1IG28_9PLEO|nr:hypothetical protein K458DRAFT_396243 [Lentithecium fluviatile CBS 122367]